MSAAGRIVERLQQARQVGPDQWRSRCPGHEGRSQSLSIKQDRDSALVHCFAGCDTEDVLSSIGLRLADLYDAPLTLDRESAGKWKREQELKDALALISSESLVILVACENLLNNFGLTPRDLNRVAESAKTVEHFSRKVPDTLKQDIQILTAIAEIIATGKEAFPVHSDRIEEIRHAVEAAGGEA